MDVRKLGQTIKRPEGFKFALPARVRSVLFTARNKPREQVALWKFIQPKKKA